MLVDSFGHTSIHTTVSDTMNRQRQQHITPPAHRHRAQHRCTQRPGPNPKLKLTSGMSSLILLVMVLAKVRYLSFFSCSPDGRRQGPEVQKHTRQTREGSPGARNDKRFIL